MNNIDNFINILEQTKKDCLSISNELIKADYLIQLDNIDVCEENINSYNTYFKDKVSYFGTEFNGKTIPYFCYINNTEFTQILTIEDINKLEPNIEIEKVYIEELEFAFNKLTL